MNMDVESSEFQFQDCRFGIRIEGSVLVWLFEVYMVIQYLWLRVKGLTVSDLFSHIVSSVKGVWL